MCGVCATLCAVWRYVCRPWPLAASTSKTCSTAQKKTREKTPGPSLFSFPRNHLRPLKETLEKPEQALELWPLSLFTRRPESAYRTSRTRPRRFSPSLYAEILSRLKILGTRPHIHCGAHTPNLMFSGLPNRAIGSFQINNYYKDRDPTNKERGGRGFALKPSCSFFGLRKFRFSRELFLF